MTSSEISILYNQKDSSLAKYIHQQVSLNNTLFIETHNLTSIQNMHPNTVAIVIMEDMQYTEILDVCQTLRERGIISVYISFYNHQLALGPTHFPGKTAGLDSALLFLKQQELNRIPTKQELESIQCNVVSEKYMQQHASLFHTLVASLLKEVKALLSEQVDKRLSLVDSISCYTRSKLQSRYVYPVFETGHTDRRLTPGSALEYKVLLDRYFKSKDHIVGNIFVGREESDTYKNVGIIGGGTSGYLTALALKKAYPKLDVTLIESSKIPVIGVGEATTPGIRDFLFDTLGLDALDFYRKVKPTWKMGIKFFWGLPGDYYFNYPFGKSDIGSSYRMYNHINNSSLTSLLMSTDSSFVVSSTDTEGKQSFSSLSNDISYALHLDNASFIGYLKEKAIEVGVVYQDDLITDAVRGEGGISHVVGEGGRHYAFDFFVDCSGFKSLLLEKVMKSDFISYHKSLYTDSAVTGCISNGNKVRPYTYAESMDNGWCWNIPMRAEDHRGYVFSSAYCSVDQATTELHRKNPSIQNFKLVKFRSGRHQEICIDNVFAVGNSYAFVEPLESTGIHMIIREAKMLAESFPLLKKSKATVRTINRTMNARWDYLRDFLSIHYKFNKKFNTAFWKDCNQDVDVSSIQWLIDMYMEVGLLSAAKKSIQKMINKEINDEIFGLSGFDTLLLGQGVIPKNLERSMQNKNIWLSNMNSWTSIQKRTIPLEDDLAILTQYPHLI